MRIHKRRNFFLSPISLASVCVCAHVHVCVCVCLRAHNYDFFLMAQEKKYSTPLQPKLIWAS